MAPKYKLSYFNLYGRGELTRLIFAAAKVEFEDHRFSFEEWPEIKSSKLPSDTEATSVL